MEVDTEVDQGMVVVVVDTVRVSRLWIYVVFQVVVVATAGAED